MNDNTSVYIATSTNIFFVEIQLKKKKTCKVFFGHQSVFWAPKPVYRSPKQPEYVTVQETVNKQLLPEKDPHMGCKKVF